MTDGDKCSTTITPFRSFLSSGGGLVKNMRGGKVGEFVCKLGGGIASRGVPREGAIRPGER